MATTDTQQTAQFAAQAAVSAAEAKQYLLSIEQPVIDISESVADAQNAAAAAEMARDQAQGISTSLVQTIDSQLSEQETQFESQMTTQQSSFESSQSERESAFEEKSNEFESRFSSQLSTQESTFSESQTDKENRFQQFLLSSGYQFLGDYENGPYVFSELNQYIEYSGNSYRIASASDIGFTTTGTDATSFANDVTHFVLMDGDTLRQELSSKDQGAQLVFGLGFWVNAAIEVFEISSAHEEIRARGFYAQNDGGEGTWLFTGNIEPLKSGTHDISSAKVYDAVGHEYQLQVGVGMGIISPKANGAKEAANYAETQLDTDNFVCLGQAINGIISALPLWLQTGNNINTQT
ncbi:hypothetical protein ACSPF6_001040, partial [Klebsiella variicola]